jgi:hypothetical protein
MIYRKVLNYLYSRPDKVIHFAAGMSVCLICSTFLPAWAAFLLAVAAGTVKEIWDEVSYGGFDWIDLAATVAGGWLVFICLVL